jgi:hypothetical protein
MNLDDFINEAEQTQENSNAFEEKKKDDEKKALEKRRSQWDRVRAVLPKLQDDFAMFDGVELNRIYSFAQPYQWNLYRVDSRRKDFKIGKPERDGYSYDSYTFESREGNFCANINLLNDGYMYDRDDIMIQVRLNPKKDKLEYLFTTKYMVFNEAERYLNLPEDKGYTEKLFDKKTRLFTTYKALKEFLLDFLKQTVNTDDLKAKKYENKILELRPKMA